MYFIFRHTQIGSLIQKKRHTQYVKAIVSSGVTPVMGKFKGKERRCPKCNHKWCSHEEKETDVNIALTLLDLAYKNKFDCALLISNDSDLTPAIRLVRKNFPDKRITTIVPPSYLHSNELIQAASDKAKIRVDHLERCLFPEVIYDTEGNIIATRPIEYDPHLVSAQ